MRLSITLLLPFFLLLTGICQALPTPRSNEVVSRESLNSRSMIDSELELDSRYFEEDGDELERRGTPYNTKARPVKITKAAQQARKNALRTNVAQRQAHKAVTKQTLAAAYAAKMADNPAFRYGKPRDASKQPPNQPGYRAKSRAKGFRLPKQPKTPKRDARKGDPKTAKHTQTQAAALARKNARIQAGRANFAHAAAQQERTDNKPANNAKFTSPGGTQTVTGKDVRRAIFNSHHFANNKVNNKPTEFRNDPQGPSNVPLPGMTGPGNEFPVTKSRGGYQGGNPGLFRVITQTNANGRHEFKGVTSHDERRPDTHPGFNDHFQVTSH